MTIHSKSQKWWTYSLYDNILFIFECFHDQQDSLSALLVADLIVTCMLLATQSRQFHNNFEHGILTNAQDACLCQIWVASWSAILPTLALILSTEDTGWFYTSYIIIICYTKNRPPACFAHNTIVFFTVHVWAVNVEPLVLRLHEQHSVISLRWVSFPQGQCRFQFQHITQTWTCSSLQLAVKCIKHLNTGL